MTTPYDHIEAKLLTALKAHPDFSDAERESMTIMHTVGTDDFFQFAVVVIVTFEAWCVLDGIGKRGSTLSAMHDQIARGLPDEVITSQAQRLADGINRFRANKNEGE